MGEPTPTRVGGLRMDRGLVQPTSAPQLLQHAQPRRLRDRAWPKHLRISRMIDAAPKSAALRSPESRANEGGGTPHRAVRRLSLSHVRRGGCREVVGNSPGTGQHHLERVGLGRVGENVVGRVPEADTRRGRHQTAGAPRRLVTTRRRARPERASIGPARKRRRRTGSARTTTPPRARRSGRAPGRPAGRWTP